jgi:aspartyl-tRNA(Asn)/glutamyl-tRNA(Gln) amidotransferase subunit A
MSAASIAQLAQELLARRISAKELAVQALARANAHSDLNAFVTLAGDHADAASDGCAHNDTSNVLCGIPFAQKDIFCTKGVRTTCGSRMLENFVPPYDSAVAERLNAAGAVLIGKTNCDEFAMGSSNENSYFGPVRNPWDKARVPGGSSGGSAAAVAAGIVAYATGTDTGGSIRQPAAFCGITGIKPTYGRVSRHGMVAFASSLDCGGVLARSAEDCASVLTVMSGHDPRDATSSRRAAHDYRADLNAPLAGLRIGLPRAYFGAGIASGVADAVHRALHELEKLGAHLIEVDLVNAALAIPAYYVIAPAEASSNLSRFDGVRYGHRCSNPASLEDMYSRSRSEGFGAEVKRRILVGTYALSAGYYDAYYLRAQRARRLIANDFIEAFAKVDILAGPTTPTVAFKIGEKSADPLQMYAADVNTVAVSLAGLPALSTPAGFSDDLPVGLQLIAPAFGEARLLNVAHQLQQVTDWHRQLPGAARG